MFLAYGMCGLGSINYRGNGTYKLSHSAVRTTSSGQFWGRLRGVDKRFLTYDWLLVTKNTIHQS